MRLKAFSALVLSGCALAACGPGAGHNSVPLETLLVVEEGSSPVRFGDVVINSLSSSNQSNPCHSKP